VSLVIPIFIAVLAGALFAGWRYLGTRSNLATVQDELVALRSDLDNRQADLAELEPTVATKDSDLRDVLKQIDAKLIAQEKWRSATIAEGFIEWPTFRDDYPYIYFKWAGDAEYEACSTRYSLCFPLYVKLDPATSCRYVSVTVNVSRSSSRVGTATDTVFGVSANSVVLLEPDYFTSVAGNYGYDLASFTCLRS